jgi:hypothetical protein
MRRLPSIFLTCVFVVACVGAASATTAHMQSLPTSSQFRCLNCHTVQDPVSSAQAGLNSFGAAFRDNGFKWDATLAAMRSDSDACTNGFELGDMNGDGQKDAGLTAERSNPGQSDCTLQINEQAWSELKKLFR